MRKILLFLLSFQVLTLLAQVGVHTDTPDNSSAMDITATNKGLLIPRVTLTSNLSSPSPVTSPAVGLLVFNSGANQPIGFYYWNGSAWTVIGGGGGTGGNDWTLTGNAGTIPGTNFLGTTDNNHFLVYTNNTERMRFESDGQAVFGSTTPNSDSHLFSVIGNSTQNFAVAAYSPTVGFYSFGGRYGMFSQLDSACNPSPGFAMYAKNTDVSGYGMYAVGSNVSSLPLITSHTAAITSYGFDGLHAWGRNTTTGHGICAVGSGQNSSFALSNTSAGVSAVGNYGIISRGTAATGRGIVAIGSGQASPSTSSDSEGGAFTGFHGIYARGVNSNGIGVIGVGSNAASYSTISGGIGGSFAGNYGAYGKGLASDGIGVLGLGSNGSGYYTVTGGSGGAFTGYHGALAVGTDVTLGTGIIAAGNNSSYVIMPAGAGGAFTGISTGAAGFGTSEASGIGVIGAGNNQAAWVPSTGCGGAFTGNYGVFCRSVAAAGTGILSAGNNIANPLVYSGGSGGAFTGTGAGVVGYGTTSGTGIGVIGVGNNATVSTPATGSGGAFTGTVCGVYGYATNGSNDRYGGYFATGGSLYAYVGGRYSNTNRKIVGSGTVSTIVKNTKGERITLVCPEAPESLFQDYGIGQLVNGYAHITIDPDLAINITVSEAHPLKVFVTLEGDCNGIYVTNKSANGFDVIELQGGTSNVPFSWQIVATRANEEYTLRDGTLEISDYSKRFQEAPPPLEFIESSNQPNVSNPVNLIQINTKKSKPESLKKDILQKSIDMKPVQDQVIELKDDLND